MLLEVDVDAAKQHIAAADVNVVGERWGIDRDQRRIVATRDQLDRQRVLAETAAAIHPSGTRGDREDLHGCTMLNAEGSMLNESASHRVVGHCALGIGTGQLPSGIDWNARALNRNSTMLPSCG